MGSCRCSAAILSLLQLAVLATAYIQFEPTMVPKDETSKNRFVATSRATYGKYEQHKFRKLARTNEDHNCIVFGCTLLGEVVDIQRANVTAYDPETLKKLTKTVGKRKTREVQFTHAPSGGVLLQEEELDRWFMLYQFESNPGGLFRMRLRLEDDTDLASRLTVPVSFIQYGGLWKPRVATTTPKGTMIGSEGIGPDAMVLGSVDCLQDDKKDDCLINKDGGLFFDVMDFMRYFKRDPETLKKEGKLKEGLSGIPGFKPYRYGFAYDVGLVVNQDDRVLESVRKLHALGRFGAAGIGVMQDGLTVYISGGKGGLYRFVDDDFRGSFRSGELSAAVIRHEPGFDGKIVTGTKFSVGWVPLGKTSAEDVASFVGEDGDLTFSDMMLQSDLKGGKCPENYKGVKVGERFECLRLVTEDLSVVFEPERLAALKGATTDVFRFSQIATRLDSDKFFIGVQEIREGALLPKKGTGSVPVEARPCGCVFQVKIDTDFTVTEMEAVMCGDTSGADEENQCNTETVANPRSLTFANQFETLLIGEDTPNHLNNYVWAYDPATGHSTRIFHAAKEGRITSLTWFQDVVGGNNYIGMTIANPFDTFGWLSYFGSFDLTSGEKLSFSNVQVPYDGGNQDLPLGFKKVTRGSTETLDGFREILKTGASLPKTGSKKESVMLGEVVDVKLKPVNSYQQGPVKPERIEQSEISHKIASASLIETCGNLFSVVTTESLPGTTYVVTLKNSKKGLKASSAVHIDWSDVGGLWRSGSAVVTPWNTHLGGELLEPDGADFLGYPCLTGFSSCFKSRADQAFQDSLSFIRYFDVYLDDLDNKFENLAKRFQPYRYGYNYEVTVNKAGCATPRKLMTLGRFSHSSQIVMPDQKTVYMSDYTTGRNVGGGLFKFVAKAAGDLTSGTLYAAKFKIKTGTLNKFDIEWIKLGSASNDELTKKAESIKFNEMFDFVPSAKRCRDGLKEINVKSTKECLNVRKGMEKWAAFFETRRYASLLGASIELANVRSLTYDSNEDKVLMAVKQITPRDKVMLQDDVEGSTNDVKVTLAPCGAIYAMEVDESYDINKFELFHAGTDDFGNIENNICNVEDVAFPGDMDVIPGHGKVLVGEDSCTVDNRGSVCGHENNAIWALDSAKTNGPPVLDRILTSPVFSGIASPRWYASINEMPLLTAVVNEVYRANTQDPVDPNDAGAVFGYFGPFTDDAADNRRVQDQTTPACINKKSKNAQCPSSRGG
ncbi:hypothetical protein BSKO_10685 [Bryopsis sp. KO-2023]|nr:hypothetical protein BSKO_10685 [Bryopsis sp. KO-2023]